MSRDKKTVLKGFTYLQCDEFAGYLSQMAAKGWHFKEWSIGLVFEKGAPEQVEYAVEVFTKSSQYDLRPDIHTLDFADYCQAAGWEFVDSRQKFCIFKKVRPDAVPILTPEERIHNVSKTHHRQLFGQLLMALIWASTNVFRFIPANHLVNAIFSNTIIITSAFFSFYLIYAVGRYIGFWIWKARAKKRCKNGETNILHDPEDRVWSYISIIAVILYTICCGALTGVWEFVIIMSSILAYILLAMLLAKLRPDSDTNLGIQIIFAVIMTFCLIFAGFLLITAKNEENTDWHTFPLHYGHLDVDAGEVKYAREEDSRSILGSKRYYFISCEKASLSYEIFESKHNWVLDIVWDYYHAMASNATPKDCTADWDAEDAYHNELISYYVRYDDAILVLHVFDDLLPSQEQIDTIRHQLGLEN